MKKQVNLYEAKTQLSKLVDAAAAGIVIAKAGKPKARLVPLEPAKLKRQPGAFRQQPGYLPFGPTPGARCAANPGQVDACAQGLE